MYTKVPASSSYLCVGLIARENIECLAPLSVDEISGVWIEMENYQVCSQWLVMVTSLIMWEDICNICLSISYSPHLHLY